MKTKSNVQVFYSDTHVTIEVQDTLSRVKFHEITMTLPEFHKAFHRNTLGESESELRGIEHVGLKQEVDNFIFSLPAGTDYKTRTAEAKKIVHREMRDAGRTKAGWVPDSYYGSQSSFFMDGKTQMARVTIRRWIKLSE